MIETQVLAKQITDRLNKHGFTAYFAGGWVRDLLMGHPSSDIDIATDATPDQILKLFPKTLKIGISFGVVIVIVDHHQFEVSTFRCDIHETGHDGRRPSSIKHTSAKEDAKRRDFTINGMFFDPKTDQVIDFVGGEQDIENQVICTIGNPEERFFEDRLRMIRAVRFAARFNFKIEENTKKAIARHASTLLPAVAKERIWQEFKKMSDNPRFDWALVTMQKLGLLSVIFPPLKKYSPEEIEKKVSNFALFPDECDPVLYLMPLFSDLAFEQMEEIFLDLKVSKREVALIQLTDQIKKMVKIEHSGSCEPIDWARIFANRHAKMCLTVATAAFGKDLQEAILAKEQIREHHLKNHIERIKQNRPLINAAKLQALGIKPGKLMGQLLQEAEKIAVNYHLEDPNDIIKHLKTHKLWPQ